MKLFIRYFKKNWFSGLLFAIPLVIFKKGYVYPELRMEFDFLRNASTYLEMLVTYSLWTFIQFFIWKVGYSLDKRKKQNSSSH